MRKIQRRNMPYVGLVLLGIAIACFVLAAFGISFFGVRTYQGQADSGWWWAIGVIFILWGWACFEKA